MFRLIIFIVILFLALPYVYKVKDKILNRLPDTIPINKTLDTLKKTSESLKEKIKK
jgi:hypothetical protein